MDTDILLALRFQANEHGIYDEELINLLCEEFMKNEHQDIDDMLDKTFKSDFTDDSFNIEFTIDSDDETYVNDVYELNSLLYTDECEIINTNQERILRTQVNSLLNPNQFMQPSGLFSNFMNNINNGNFTQESLFELFAQNMQNVQNVQNVQNAQPFPGSVVGGMFGNFGLGGILNNMLHMQPVQVTLTGDALDNLEVLKYDQVKEKLPNLNVDEQCSICLDKLDKDTDNTKYIILPCEHVFHDNCIKEHLKDYDYHCPICRCECGEHEAKIDG